MTSQNSAVENIVSSVHTRIEDLLADQYSRETYPHAAKVISVLALVGVYCVSRNLLKKSQTLSKYCLLAKTQQDPTSLPGRYGKPAWAMIVNSVDALGNAYGHHLGSAGFDILLLGPEIDSDRMEGQAKALKKRYKVQTRVICVDYHQFSDAAEKTHQEIADKIADYDICILVNNQAYSVPFDYAHHSLLEQSVQSVLATINKHIKTSLLIQQLIVPKMLVRHTRKKKRSGILTLKTQANAIFESIVVKKAAFPILKSTMAFNSALTAAMHEQYSDQGIDVMQAVAPYVAFESWLKQGLVLEVVMQERMLARHVTSVFSHLMQGYADSHGNWETALQTAAKMPRTASFGLFLRHAEMTRELAAQMPAIQEGSQVQVCDQDVETSFELAIAEETDVKEAKVDWSNVDPTDIMETFEENEFDFPPMDGEKLEFKNERKIWQAEMSQNMRLTMEATSMSQDRLLEMKKTGKPVMAAQFAQQVKEQLQKKMAEMKFITSKAKPVEIKPVEVKTSETVPVETNPEEVKPVEVKKLEVTEASEVKKTKQNKPKTKKAKAKEVDTKFEEAKVSGIKRVESTPTDDLKISQSTAANSLQSSQTSHITSAPKELKPEVQAAKSEQPISEQSKPSPATTNEESEKTPPVVVQSAASKVMVQEPKPEHSVVIEEPKLLQPNPEVRQQTNIYQRFDDKKPGHTRTASSTPASESLIDSKLKEKPTLATAEEKPLDFASMPVQAAGPIEAEKQFESASSTPREKSNSCVSKTKSAAKLELQEETINEASISEKPAFLPTSANNEDSKKSDFSGNDKSSCFIISATSDDQQSNAEHKTTKDQEQLVARLDHIKDSRDKIKAPSMSVASSEPTNDTQNNSSLGEDERKDKKQTQSQPQIAPKPYNRLSKTRAETAQSNQEDKNATEINFKNGSFKEDVVTTAAEPAEQLTQEQKAQEVAQVKAPEAKNCFSPTKTTGDSPQLIKHQRIETPCFKSLESGFVHVKKDSASSPDHPNSNSDIVSRDSSVGKQFMVVKPTSVESLNRSMRSGSNSISRISENEKSREWRQSPLKEINITSLVQRVKKKAQVSAALTVADPAYNKNIEFLEKTLDDSGDPFGHISERQLEQEASEESKVDQDINAMRKSLPLMHDNIGEGLPEGEAPISGRSIQKEITPRSNADHSSSSDMRELKMALGGFSDRSGNNNANFNYNSQTNILDIEGPIFSDEGSQDSMGHAAAQDHDQSEAAKQERVWEMAANAKKSSLAFMKSITQKFEKGDETDQAIKKVLYNLVTNVLSNFDPDNSSRNDSNLTSAQKLEKENQVLIYELATCLPFVKLSSGRYIVGTEIRSIQIKGRGVLVRTGGGFMYLSEFLLHYAKSECLKMGLLIIKAQQRSKKANYQKVVIDILKKHPNTETAQKDFIRRCPPDLNDQFQELVDRTRKHEEKMQKQRQRKSIKVSRTHNADESLLDLSMHSSDSNRNRRQTLFPPQTHKIFTPVRSSPNRQGSSSSSPSKSPPVIKASNQIVSAKAKISLNRSLNSSFSSPTLSSKRKSKGHIEPKFSLTMPQQSKADQKQSLNNSFSAASLVSRPSGSAAATGSLFKPVRSKQLTTASKLVKKTGTVDGNQE